MSEKAIDKENNSIENCKREYGKVKDEDVKRPDTTGYEVKEY